MEFDILDNFDVTEGRVFYAEYAVSSRTSLNFVFFMNFYYRTAWYTAVDARQADPWRRLLSGMPQLWRLKYRVDIIKQQTNRAAFKCHHNKLCYLYFYFQIKFWSDPSCKNLSPNGKNCTRYSVSDQRKSNIFSISKVSTGFTEFGLEVAETVLGWGNKHIFLENRRKNSQFINDAIFLPI